MSLELPPRCSNGECIPEPWRCNGRSYCSDGSDESRETCGDNCGGMDRDKGYGGADGRFQCSNGQGRYSIDISGKKVVYVKVGQNI